MLSIFYYTFFLLFTPKISIGIVGVDNIDSDFLQISKDGFDKYYSNYFDVEVLSFNLNSSNIRTQEVYYLNSDFFRTLEEELKSQNIDYDYYLIVTDKPILDFDCGSMGYWGQANTNNSMALITTYYFNSKSKDDNLIIQSHAIHEVLHLFGYLHNMYDLSGIMQYKNLHKLELAPYYKFQLPIKTFFSKYVKIENFLLNAYFKNLVILPFWLFLFFGIEFLVRAMECIKLRYVVERYDLLLGCLFILILFGVFYNYIFSLFVLILFLQIALHLYVLEKKGYWILGEKITKNKNKK